MPDYSYARPFIKYYDLKKDMAFCPFDVFLSDYIVLCLSGKGGANAAAATAYILTRFGKEGLFVHLAASTNEPLLPVSITFNGETAYPELLYKPPPLLKEESLADEAGLYAFLAASRFIPLNNIIILRSNNSANEVILIWLETIYTAFLPFGWQEGGFTCDIYR